MWVFRFLLLRCHLMLLLVLMFLLLVQIYQLLPFQNHLYQLSHCLQIKLDNHKTSNNRKPQQFHHHQLHKYQVHLQLEDVLFHHHLVQCYLHYQQWNNHQVSTSHCFNINFILQSTIQSILRRKEL